MIVWMRHIAVRLWLTFFVGGMLSIWILPTLQTRIGLQWVWLPAGGILVLVFWLVGWIGNQWDAAVVDRLIQEAGAYERDGMFPEAGEAFRRALSVCDSFLLSPKARKEASSALASRLARFYLAQADMTPERERFLMSYLLAHPHDEDVAEQWVRLADSDGGLGETHQELAARLADAHPRNDVIQQVLARFFLMLERTDFTALQTYRRVLDRGGRMSDAFVRDAARLFIREGRTDEGALGTYLAAWDSGGERTELLRAIAACCRWTPETERSRLLLQRARRLVADAGESALESMIAGFGPPAEDFVERQKEGGLSIRSILAGVWRLVADLFVKWPMSAAGWAARASWGLVSWFFGSRKRRRALAGVLLAAMAVGVGVLVVNTIGYLRPSPQPSETPAAKVSEPVAQAVVVTDPYTLQVAAFTNPEYAERYVADLKNQGVEAYWMKAEGKSRIWYQVRVSHFPDKEAARSYGEQLKSQGMIDDFYVANYEEP
jgi:hypothetical protein